MTMMMLILFNESVIIEEGFCQSAGREGSLDSSIIRSQRLIAKVVLSLKRFYLTRAISTPRLGCFLNRGKRTANPKGNHLESYTKISAESIRWQSSIWILSTPSCLWSVTPCCEENSIARAAWCSACQVQLFDTDSFIESNVLSLSAWITWINFRKR